MPPDCRRWVKNRLDEVVRLNSLARLCRFFLSRDHSLRRLTKTVRLSSSRERRKAKKSRFATSRFLEKTCVENPGGGCILGKTLPNLQLYSHEMRTIVMLPA